MAARTSVVQVTAIFNKFKKEKAAKPAAKGGKKVSKAPSGASDRTLWLPNVEAPEWLDGSLPGDSGFDPLGLSKPSEYLIYDLDALDQNKPKNPAGKLLGSLVKTDNSPKEDALQPYSDVFDIIRFRECELIHGRWAMLGALGAIVAELSTGINWVDAGKVELEQGSSYAGLSLPFDIVTLLWIQALSMGFVEIQRSKNLDPEGRLYPGGKFFDPLNLTGNNEEQTFRLKTAELKHGRLAMVAFFGYGVQSFTTGTGSILGNLENVF